MRSALRKLSSPPAFQRNRSHSTSPRDSTSPRGLLAYLNSSLEQKDWNGFENTSKKIKPDFWLNHSAEFIKTLTTSPIFENLLDMEKVTDIFLIIHGKCEDVNEEAFVTRVSNYISLREVYTNDLFNFTQALAKEHHPDGDRLNKSLKDRRQTTKVKHLLVQLNAVGFSEELKSISDEYWNGSSKSFITMVTSKGIFESLAEMGMLSTTLQTLIPKIPKETLEPFIDRAEGYIQQSLKIKADFNAFAETLQTIDENRGKKLQTSVHQKLDESIDSIIVLLEKSFEESDKTLFTQTLGEIPSVLWKDQGLQIVSTLGSYIDEIIKMDMLSTTQNQIKKKTSEGCQKQFAGSLEQWKIQDRRNKYIKALKDSLQNRSCDSFIITLDTIPKDFLGSSDSKYILAFLIEYLKQIKEMGMLGIVRNVIENNMSKVCATQFAQACEEDTESSPGILTLDLP